MSVNLPLAKKILENTLAQDARSSLKNKLEAERQLFGPKAESESIKNRGLSFINAAIKMLENKYETDVSDGRTLKVLVGVTAEKEAIEKLERFKQSWIALSEQNLKNPTLALDSLINLLCKNIKENVFNNKVSDDKVLSDLCNAENHVNWKARADLQTVVKLDDDTFQVRIDKPITRFTQEQEHEWKKILLEKEKERPKWFTKLSSWEQHELRARVKKWQEANAQINADDMKKNLGDFLGVPPTTIRGYPGARNGYESHFYTFKRDPANAAQFKLIGEMHKIRSGHISPSKMKSPKERMLSAKENLKQLILAGVKEKVESGQTAIFVDMQTLITPPFSPADNEMDKDRLKAIDELRKEFSKDKNAFKNFLNKNGVKVPENNIPMLTLVTSNYPVNQGRSYSNFLAPLQVIFAHLIDLPALWKNLRRDFPNPIKMLFSIVLHAFSPIIELRVAIKRASENSDALKEIETRLQAIEAQMKEKPASVTDSMKEQAAMARAALSKIAEISGVNRLSNFLTGKIGGWKLNHNAERAALEQIAVSGIGGVRIGSCMSGKDREGGVSIHIAAMTAFYAKYNRFPPIPGVLGLDNKKRDSNGFTEAGYRREYERIAAEQFLAGHDQKIAEANAQGANGLKDVGGILGKNILDKAKSLLAERHTKKESNPDQISVTDEYWINNNPSKLSNKIAHLNRVKLVAEPRLGPSNEQEVMRAQMDATLKKQLDAAASKGAEGLSNREAAMHFIDRKIKSSETPTHTHQVPEILPSAKIDSSSSEPSNQGHNNTRRR